MSFSNGQDKTNSGLGFGSFFAQSRYRLARPRVQNLESRMLTAFSPAPLGRLHLGISLHRAWQSPKPVTTVPQAWKHFSHVAIILFTPSYIIALYYHSGPQDACRLAENLSVRCRRSHTLQNFLFYTGEKTTTCGKCTSGMWALPPASQERHTWHHEISRKYSGNSR